MQIEGKEIGGDNPAFIIAEAGSNHNRSLSLAKELIDAASEAKADAVKFQMFKGERHYSKYTPSFSNLEKHPVELLKDLELPLEWLPELKAYAQKKEIIFFSSVTDYLDVIELEKIDAPAYKLASFEIVDLPLIEYVAKLQKPFILSTGLATLEEIDDAYKAAKKYNNAPILLQCASAYPSPASIMNLNAMSTLRHAFADSIIGLSDHTLGTHISVAAVAMGAKVIEKHFTLDNKMQGPDHSFAIEPHELKELVAHCHDVESAFGNGEKGHLSEPEKENYDKARRSLHALVDIKKGERITKEQLVIKRPGYGIKPKFMELVEGRVAQVDIKADEWITWDKL